MLLKCLFFPGVFNSLKFSLGFCGLGLLPGWCRHPEAPGRCWARILPPRPRSWPSTTAWTGRPAEGAEGRDVLLPVDTASTQSTNSHRSSSLTHLHDFALSDRELSLVPGHEVVFHTHVWRWQLSRAVREDERVSGSCEGTETFTLLWLYSLTGNLDGNEVPTCLIPAQVKKRRTELFLC